MEGKVQDINIEHVECLETRCKGQDNLLQEQRERICSLKADRDQVSPVRFCEVERAHDMKGYMPSFGGVESVGSLGVTQAPSMIVSECVQGMRNMVWMSAQAGAGKALTQIAVSVTDVSNEPPERDKVILETAPAPWDSACEVRECARFVLCKPPKRGPLHEVLMASE